MKRLSIIIPMYNVAPYVERCIRSLEDQDIPPEDYELICINDGSPDKCGEIVTQLQHEFSNIVLINQENQGVSMARNNGIDKARGKYLLMIDPDDCIKPNIFKDCLHHVISNNLDVGFTGYIILDENDTEQYRFDPYYQQNNILTGIHFFNQYMKGKYELRDPDRSWAIFFKTEFLNASGIQYLAGVPYLEDGELMARVYCLAKRVSFINDPFYLRTTRPGSATHSKLYYSDKARNGFVKAANNLLQFKLNHCKNEEQKVFMNQPIIKFTLLYLTSIKVSNYIKYYSKLFNTLKKGPLNKLDTEGCNSLYKRMGNWYNRSIHIFYLNWLFLRFYNYIKKSE